MFWIISALLILIAFAFLIPPMLRKQESDSEARRQQNILIANEQLEELETRYENGEIDKNDYEQGREELEVTLYANVKDDDALAGTSSRKPVLSVLLVILIIPLISILFYLKIGNPLFTTALDSREIAAEAMKKPDVPRKADGTPDIDAMVAGLQKKMEQNPDNAKGWFMLGRSYMVLKRYPDAVSAYEKALKLMPESANIMLSLADAMAMTTNGNISGRPAALINKALSLEPNNLTALWLGGMAARQQGDHVTAIKRWTKVLAQISDPKEQQEVKALIAEASKQLTGEQKDQLGLGSEQLATALKTPVADQDKTTSQASTKQGITLNIALSPEMKTKANPNDLVFVYAKAMSGPPMPLAAAKVQVKDLPLKVVLTDEMAMIPSMKLSSFKQVKVGARVSKSGQPISQNGDLYTEKPNVEIGQTVDLLINDVVKK